MGSFSSGDRGLKVNGTPPHNSHTPSRSCHSSLFLDILPETVTNILFLELHLRRFLLFYMQSIFLYEPPCKHPV